MQGFYPEPGLGLLWVWGPEAASFLHNQSAARVVGMASGESTAGLFLNSRGQIEFLARIVCQDPERFALFVAGGDAAALLTRCERYRIFDQVEFELEPGRGYGFVADPPLPEGALFWRDGELGEIFLPAGAELECHLEPDQIQLYQVERLIPSLVEARGRLPQEVGLGAAVAPNKGCYLGQEIMARLEARGQAHYGLGRLSLPQILPEGTSLELAGREVGRLGRSVKSGSGYLGLAVIRREIGPGSPLRAGTHEVTVEICGQ